MRTPQPAHEERNAKIGCSQTESLNFRRQWVDCIMQVGNGQGGLLTLGLHLDGASAAT